MKNIVVDQERAVPVGLKHDRRALRLADDVTCQSEIRVIVIDPDSVCGSVLFRVQVANKVVIDQHARRIVQLDASCFPAAE